MKCAGKLNSHTECNTQVTKIKQQASQSKLWKSNPMKSQVLIHMQGNLCMHLWSSILISQKIVKRNRYNVSITYHGMTMRNVAPRTCPLLAPNIATTNFGLCTLVLQKRQTLVRQSIVYSKTSLNWWKTTGLCI